MAKDTEKLIRQLSLISFLMAERRPVSALEIKADVEGYSQMNDEAFARRFYADRSELESLGIELKVDKPAEGYYEAENYSLPPENFYLPAIEFTDEELGALRMSLYLLDGEFAYAEPLRLALQQLSWGKPSPLDAPEERSVALAVTAGAGGRELSQRLSKVETAIFRRKTILFDYYTIGRDAEEKRKVDPYHLLFRGGQFYLIGYSHERDDVRVFRVSRIRGKVGYSSKAEHDFNRPEEFDPRVYATRTDWQLGDPVGTARASGSRTGSTGSRCATSATPARVTEDDDGRGLRDRVRRLAPAGLLGPRPGRPGAHPRAGRAGGRGARAARARGRAPHRHARARGQGAPAPRGGEEEDADERDDSPIRPERFARLVTLAGILIDAAREAHKLEVGRAVRAAPDLRAGAAPGHRRAERRELRRRQLRALRRGHRRTRSRSTPSPTATTSPARPGCSPLEAKALVAAIDLIGEHLPEGSLASARARRSWTRSARTRPPRASRSRPPRATTPRSRAWCPRAIADRRLLRIEYYKENEDEFTAAHDRALQAGQRPGGLVRALASTSTRTTPRSYRLDRIREATVLDETFEPREGIEPDVHGWLSTGEVPSSSTARIWISPERARWAREDRRVVRGALRRRGGGGAHLRLARVAVPRDPEGGRRRRGAGARGGPRRRARGRRGAGRRGQG